MLEQALFGSELVTVAVAAPCKVSFYVCLTDADFPETVVDMIAVLAFNVYGRARHVSGIGVQLCSHIVIRQDLIERVHQRAQFCGTFGDTVGQQIFLLTLIS